MVLWSAEIEMLAAASDGKSPLSRSLVQERTTPQIVVQRGWIDRREGACRSNSPNLFSAAMQILSPLQGLLMPLAHNQAQAKRMVLQQGPLHSRGPGRPPRSPCPRAGSSAVFSREMGRLCSSAARWKSTVRRLDVEMAPPPSLLPPMTRACYPQR
jgi:hypothetical protein